jgi:Fis family transcriptional regulator
MKAVNMLAEKAESVSNGAMTLDVAAQCLETGDRMVDIAACLSHHFEVYFQDLDGATPSHLHQMMLSACEKPLLEWVMAKTRNNQSLASEWLGVNRATLRKKLQQYDLL